MCKDADKHLDVLQTLYFMFYESNQHNVLKDNDKYIQSVEENTPATTSPNLWIQLKNTIVSICSHADIYDIINDHQYQ